MSDLDRVWIGLRSDGVELARVEAQCVEVSRGNGIVKYKALGAVVFVDIPADVSQGHLTIAESEHGRPFAAAPLDSWQTLRAGDTVKVDPLDFEVVIDVPRYKAPEPKRKKQRLRLGH